MNPIGERPEFIIAFDVEFMTEGEYRCETVKARTPALAIEKIKSYWGSRTKILSPPKYHPGCNRRYIIWEYLKEKEEEAAGIKRSVF